MSEHLTQIQIVDYGRRPIPTAEWLFVSDHLAVCEECRLQVEEVVDTEATFLSLKSGIFDKVEGGTLVAEDIHLTFEQMAGFVDETIVDLQVVEEHLAWCEACETAVEDLRAFKEQIAPELEQESSLPPIRGTTESPWHRLLAAMISLQPKSAVLVFGSALAILLVTIGWLASLALPGMNDKTEVGVIPPSPGVSPSTLPSSPPESSAAVMIARINDGEGEISLDESGRLLGVEHLPSTYQQMVKKALTDQRIERSSLLAGLIQPGSRSRGQSGTGSAKFSVIEPVGAVILSNRPTFRWTKLDGATGYVVEVYDEFFNQLVSSPQITHHSWTAPRSLKRDGTYYWQVKAIKDGQEFKAPRPPAPQAKFRILDEATADDLAKARRDYGSSHLVLGLLYAEAGLLEEAELEFKALVKNNPDSALGNRLLRQVQTRP